MKLFKTLLVYKLSLLLVFSLLAPSAAFAQRRKAAAPTKSTIAKKEVETETAQVCEVWSGTIQYKQHRAKTETKVTNKGEHISDQHYTGTHITKSSYDYNGTFNVVSSSGNTYEDGSKSIKLKGAMSADVMRVMDEKDDWKTETNCFPDKPNIRVAGRNSTSNITESGKLAKTSDDGWMNIKGSEFKISFAIPRIEGTRVHKTTMKPFGWCLMDKNPPHDSTHESTADSRVRDRNCILNRIAGISSAVAVYVAARSKCIRHGRARRQKQCNDGLFARFRNKAEFANRQQGKNKDDKRKSDSRTLWGKFRVWIHDNSWSYSKLICRKKIYSRQFRTCGNRMLNETRQTSISGNKKAD